LVWDHLVTLHRAVADYGPEKIRLIRWCQVMATKVFDPTLMLLQAKAMACSPFAAMLAAGLIGFALGYLIRGR
jgi:hypothetical protein